MKPIDNRRRRNPGHAVRYSKIEKTEDRATIVRDFEFDADNNWMSPAEAKAKNLAGFGFLSQKIGVSASTLHTWRQRHYDFPKPVGRLHEASSGHVYDAFEVFDWTKSAIEEGRIRSPK